MEIARTSMEHACAPHFLWPYAVRYAAYQLNLWACVSRLEVSPTCLWTGPSRVVSEFHVWDCLAHVHNPPVNKLLTCTLSCVFLGFLVNAPEFMFNHPPLHWFFDSLVAPDFAFYNPPLHSFLDSRDVCFDDSMSYYACFLHRGLPVPPPPLFLAPTPPPGPAPPVRPPHPGPALSGVSQATPPPFIARQVSSPSP
ncbi:unnamed protein product [Closterium sp. NIES-54]